MRKIIILFGTLATLAVPALAADDPIATRKALMDSNGAAAGISGAMLKGEIPYAPAIAKAAISSLHATALAYGSFFPAGSDVGDTTASPKIWEDAAGFQAELAKFQTATAAANAAAGKDGPADAAAFGAAMGPVFDTCKSCHEGYRIKK